jgi:hypothetical protein
MLCHALNKHEEKKTIVKETFFKKGSWILFGKFKIFSNSFKWFLVGPLNYIFTHMIKL